MINRNIAGSMAPTITGEAGYGMDDLSPPFCSVQSSLADLDNSCETFFCRRNSPMLLRTAIPEASSTFRKALGNMNSRAYEEDSDDSDEDEDDDDDTWTSSSSSSPTTVSSSVSSRLSSSSSSSPSPSSSYPSSHRSKPVPASSCGKHTQSHFLSVPSSLPSFGSFSYQDSHFNPAHPDSSDSGAHKTLAGLSLRQHHLSSRRASSFSGSGDYANFTSGAGGNHYSSFREKKVSWADERGTKHQLIHVRLIRPRLSMDASIGVTATPTHSILRRPIPFQG